jgi:hypothetical protein
MNISQTITALLTAALLAVCLGAQARAGQSPSDKSTASTATETAKPGSSAPAAGVVCPLSVGTAFNARLLQGLDARKNKAGDKFRAEVTETVRYGRSVIFPRGTIIEGHVVRQSVSTHGADRAALFLQFDKAILKNGQEAVMNAGIQALAVGPTPAAPVEAASTAEDNDSDAPSRPEAAPASPSKLDTNLNADGSAKNVVAVSHAPEDGHAAMIHPPAVDLPLTQGAFTKGGLITSDSKGALGAPDIRLYTPLSSGSDGTVMMSTKKNVHLERGTRLLVVIQPPRVSDSPAN